MAWVFVFVVGSGGSGPVLVGEVVVLCVGVVVVVVGGVVVVVVVVVLVVLGGGAVLDDAMRARLNHAVRTALSPRFVPDDIFQVAEVPRTLSGKKQELPIKKLLLGQPLEKVLNRDAMANPHCLDWYVGFAQQRLARPG